MKNTIWGIILFLIINIGCKKDQNDIPESTKQQNTSSITSVEFQDDLLFVNKNDFQIATSEAAQFISEDPGIQISLSGLITRITSGEVVPIDITWTGTGTKTRIYALGATDNNHDQPYARYHGENATDAYAAYKQGWKTLQKLPSAIETYGIILRHGDADIGRDVRTGFEWWKSCNTAQARQLNNRGKQRSAELGVIFKDLQYPITRVISSEFCRARATAELVNAGPIIVTDGRINHPEYNRSGMSLFNGMLAIMNEQPIDNKMTLIVTHHPINEKRNNNTVASFPAISPFTWTGVYFVRINPDKTITYEGAASWAMLNYWRNKKLKK